MTIELCTIYKLKWNYHIREVKGCLMSGIDVARLHSIACMQWTLFIYEYFVYLDFNQIISDLISRPIPIKRALNQT